MRVISRVAVVDISAPRSLGAVGGGSFYRAYALLSNVGRVKVHRTVNVQRTEGQRGGAAHFRPGLHVGDSAGWNKHRTLDVQHTGAGLLTSRPAARILLPTARR